MIRFYLNRPDSETSPLMMYASFFSWRVRRSLNISVVSRLFNSDTGRMKPITQDYIHLNNRLSELSRRGEEIAFSRKVRGETITPDEFIGLLFSEKPKDRHNIHQQFADFLDFKKERLKQSTVKVYGTVGGLLKEFNPKSFTLTAQVVKDYEHFMVRLLYNPNVILKHIQILKQFAEYIGSPVVYKPGIKHKPHDSVSLSEAEIDQIWQTKVPIMYQNAKKILVLMCYTGMRISDALKFKPDAIQNIRGAECIVYTSQKTAKKCVIPMSISPYLRMIADDMFYPISETHIREYIKELCKRAGIVQVVEFTTYQGQQHTTAKSPKYELVTSHTGRRSFVTNMFYRGLTPAEVMPMTGHTMTSIVETYNKLSAEDNAVKLSRR